MLQVAKGIKTEKAFSAHSPPESVSFVDCVAVSISPELGERISLSAAKSLLEEVRNSTFLCHRHGVYSSLYFCVTTKRYAIVRFCVTVMGYIAVCTSVSQPRGTQ